MTKCNEYYIEATRVKYRGHIGKCLWSPIGRRWKIMEELKPNNCIIHYFTIRAQDKEYKKVFVGYSKVISNAEKLDREMLIDRLKEMGIWNKDYERFAREWLDKYDRFYFVTLGDFIEFKHKVKVEDIRREFPDFKTFQHYIARLNSKVAEIILYKGTKGEIKSACLNPMTSHLISEIEKLLSKFGQIIIFGPPGTGKTFLANCYLHIQSSSSDGICKIVTFHKSYGYEEFIEGIWPIVENQLVKYKVKDGIFKEMAIRAIYSVITKNKAKGDKCAIGKEIKDSNRAPSYEEIKNKVQECLKSILDGNENIDPKVFKDSPKYILVIDEINRGDISRIFGELITLLEYDKRLSRSNQIIVKLPYSGDLFAIPPNFYIIGTMNSTDRSIAIVDYALRRRFAFLELSPEPDLLGNKVVDKLNLRDLLDKINNSIRKELGSDFEIGHGYFLNVNDKESLYRVWYYQIVPLLREYFYSAHEALERIFYNMEKLYDIGKARRVSPEELVNLLTKWIESNEI